MSDNCLMLVEKKRKVVMVNICQVMNITNWLDYYSFKYSQYSYFWVFAD
jgi:hypothetical protein